MENSSKSLVIAAAIVLCIIIVAAGMYIYSSSHNSISEAGSQISDQEKMSFNSQWNIYEGEQGGNNIKSLLQKLIANTQTNSNEVERLVNIYCYYPTASMVQEFGFNVDSTNYEEYISYIQNIRNRIEPKHKYYVTLDYSSKTTLVNQINIYFKQEDVSNFYIDMTKENLGSLGK